MNQVRLKLPLALYSGLIACALIAGACSSGEDEGAASEDPASGAVTAEASSDVTDSDKKSYVVFADFVNETDSLPRLRFRDDGQVSLNDRCAVRQVKLNPKMQPAYVNGRPVGFC